MQQRATLRHRRVASGCCFTAFAVAVAASASDLASSSALDTDGTTTPCPLHRQIPWLLRPGFVFVFWGIILWRLWRWCQTFCNLSRRIVLIFVRSWPKYEEMHSAACKNRRNPSVFMVWLHVRSQGSPLSALEQSEESATALPGRFVWFSAEALGLFW